jgi:membrane-bound metal-dependent hydrolase YbcI (DUF457 family)
MTRSLQCLALIFAADWVIANVRVPWLAIGLFDEPAHLATAYLLGGPDPVFLAGSLLPDVDHIPLAFRDPQPGDPRPNTHSLLALGAVALVSRRLAAGVGAHFIRDLALIPGVPLLWPLTRRARRLPYPAYAAALIAAAAWRSRPGSEERRGGTSAQATGSA